MRKSIYSSFNDDQIDDSEKLIQHINTKSRTFQEFSTNIKNKLQSIGSTEGGQDQKSSKNTDIVNIKNRINDEILPELDDNFQKYQILFELYLEK